MGLLTRLFGRTPPAETGGNGHAAPEASAAPAKGKLAGLPDSPPPTYPRLVRGRPPKLHFAYHQSEDWFRKNASSAEAGARPHAKGQV